MQAIDHFRDGRLAEALAAATADVKAHPADLTARTFFCELLCFAGDWERADRQLDALSNLEPKTAVHVAVWRQLIRAERARQQFHAEGRVPEFLGQPTADFELRLKASIALRENDPAAAELLREAEDLRPKVKGEADGQPFDDCRDLDDLTASFFEVLTTTGKYFWVPFERVEEATFEPPSTPRDQLWRQVQMVVRGGPDGTVFLPVLYAGTCAAPREALCLGRETDWRKAPPS
ncbi:MAG TPA: type VI secretion system accessory protein TagJ, partial [Pirellulales bacterium]|nr:type VI secretion system accessory protein TagJ [Pirellulales bacterium]